MFKMKAKDLQYNRIFQLAEEANAGQFYSNITFVCKGIDLENQVHGRSILNKNRAIIHPEDEVVVFGFES